MFQKIIFGLLSVSTIASATAAVEMQSKIDSTVEAIESRRGLDIGGTVRAVYVKSTVSSDQDVNAINQMPDREMNEFVQLDLDMKFRPWDNIRANLLLRLGAGMQDYFANSATMVNGQWINVEGEIGKSFHWTVGDFRQSYSPLTVFLPGVDIMYEPTIFARNREMAQKEALIDGNQRNLQGINLQFRKNLDPVLGEFRAEAFFARLRRAERLDTTGAEGNLLPGEGIDGALQTGTFDKYATAANLEWFPFDRNLMVGATYLYVFDDEKSKATTFYKNDLYASNGGSQPEFNYIKKPVNFRDSLPQSTHVISARVGGDVAGILKSKKMILDLTAEAAYSIDKFYQESAIPQTGLVPLVDGDGNVVLDPVTSEPVYDVVLLQDINGVPYDTSWATINAKEENDKGLALNANINVGYKTDSWMVKASADYIRNDSSWYNSLAQSPSFIANRIMNSDKDGNLSKYGVYAPLYSSFDALYFFTPKHAPASTNLKNDDMENGQTESYNIAPYSKTSWGSNAYTRKELALIDQLSDASIQMALPNGLATANRTGIRANLLAGYGKDNMIEVQGLFTKLDQVEGIGSSKISYTEYGGGAKIDVFALIGIDLPLELSGSYKHSERSIGNAEFTSDFINVGLYVRYLKRLGIAAGFQMINSELNTTAALSQSFRMSNLKVDVAPILKGTQKQWMVGLDYTLAPHAWLAINYGQTMVSNKYYTAGLVDASGVVNSETNLPDYISGINAESNAQTIKHEFTRDIIQATINVEF